jgi:hypothetical protein
MKNLIYICIFKNEDYIELLYLLLESIWVFGNLSDNTHILIYTSTEFSNKIKASIWFTFYTDSRLLFMINDTYNTIETACSSRLDLFNFPITEKYNRILYLDTDILVKSDLNPIFDLIEEDVLYALEEGRIDTYTGGWDYWGNQLFKEDINKYEDKSAFSSGILLFNNCDIIRTLFMNIRTHMQIEKPPYICYDQPYIVYGAKTMGIMNNKTLNEWAVINDLNIYGNKTLIHFAGGVGIHIHKYINMMQYLKLLLFLKCIEMLKN